MGRRVADKLFKLPVDIKKSTLLFKLRMPCDLLEAANPGCPEQFTAGDTVSLGRIGAGLGLLILFHQVWLIDSVRRSSNRVLGWYGSA